MKPILTWSSISGALIVGDLTLKILSEASLNGAWLVGMLIVCNLGLLIWMFRK